MTFDTEDGTRKTFHFKIQNAYDCTMHVWVGPEEFELEILRYDSLPHNIQKLASAVADNIARDYAQKLWLKYENKRGR